VIGSFEHLAKAHWERGITTPAGMSAVPGRAESLDRTRSSAWATAWSVEMLS
jgi:hypothetical protein